MTEKSQIRQALGVTGDRQATAGGDVNAVNTAVNNATIGINTLLSRLSDTRANRLENLDAAITTRSTPADIPTFDLTALNADVQTLLTRLTDSRAASLDNLGDSLGGLAEAVWTFDVGGLDPGPGHASQYVKRLDVAISTRTNQFQVANELDHLLTTYSLDLAWNGIDTLLNRLTEARAGYLDNLNAGGTVATQVDLSGIQNNTRTTISMPASYVVPGSGSQRFVVYLNNYNIAGQQEDLDVVPSIAIYKPDGTLHTNAVYGTSIGGTPVTEMEQNGGETGRYYAYIEIDNTDTVGQYVVNFEMTEGGLTRYADRNLTLVAAPEADFNSADRTMLTQLHALRPDYKPAIDSSGRVDLGQIRGNHNNAEYLGNLAYSWEDDGYISADVVAMSTAVRNLVADAVWDETLSSHQSSGSTGRALQDATSAAGLDLAGIADAVWDENMSAHQSAGTAGQYQVDGGQSTAGAVNEMLQAALQDFFLNNVGLNVTQVQANSFAHLLARTFRVRPGGDFIQIPLRHYEDTNKNYHIEIEITDQNDTNFSSPDYVYDTTSNRSNLFYTLDGAGQSQSLTPYPSGGISATTTNTNPDQTFATVWLFLDDTAQKDIIDRDLVMIRVRQSHDGGASWGNWLVEPLRLG
ncbi:MAG: hypothetical protein AAGD32_13700 [Planctomycetota bacterium]